MRSRWWLALAGVVFCVSLLGISGLPHGYMFTGDSPHLVEGTHAALDCIHVGQWRDCGRESDHRSSVHAYPLLQYLPAVVMVKAGLSDLDALRGLRAISFFSFVATLALVGVAGRRLRAPVWTPMLLVVVLSSPLLLYSTSAFGEMLSAAVILGLVVATLGRRPVLIAVLALLAGLSKETLPPLIVALGIVAGTDERDHWWPPARVLAPLIGGSAAAVMIGGLFNQFRYATWGNANYLQPGFRIGAVRAARNLWNLLVATDGGLAWFWTSVSLLLVGLAVVGLTGLGRPPRSSSRQPLLVLATFGALMVTLASWWAPFGWIAYGPRLALPMLPALAVLAVKAGGDRLAGAVGAILRRRWAFAVLLVTLLISAWPQAGAPWQAQRLSRLIQVPDATCPHAFPRLNRAFYDCADHKAWRRQHNQLLEASHGGGAAADAERLAIVLTVTLLMFEARRRQRAQDSRSATNRRAAGESNAGAGADGSGVTGPVIRSTRG